MKFTKDQWPDNIVSGDICYGKAHNYDGFYLADASHGIPTLGSVSDSDPVTIRGQHVKVFNYPGQTEAIAAQLVHRWNCHVELLEALTTYMSASQHMLGAMQDGLNVHGALSAFTAADEIAREAIAKAKDPSNAV